MADDVHASLEEILDEVEQSTGASDMTEQGAQSSEAVPAGATLSGAWLPDIGLIAKLPALMELMKVFKEPSEPYCSGKPSGDACITLLHALRPYLNQNRQQAVDTMIRLSRLRDGINALR